MPTISNAIILARVSSKTQEDEGYSLDSQLKLMRNYCKAKKLNVVQEFKIAETASKEQRRKVFHELVVYITTRKIHHLVVEKTDRLTRNFKDATTIDGWLEGDDRRMLHMVKENLLLHKNARSDAKFMWNIYLSVAKKYTDNLREEVMKGWAEKLAQGWLPAPPPPGYMTVTKEGKRIHAINPDTYKLMPRVFKLALLPDYTLARLSDEMAAMGILTGGNKPFSKSYISQRILANPFYIGINVMDGKKYPGAQEPIISKRLFRAVQEKVDGKRHKIGKTKHNPVFKGMISCNACGSQVTWSKQKGRFYGACKRTQDNCKGEHYLREDRVENELIQKLEEISDNPSKVVAKLEAVLRIAQPQDVGQHRQRLIIELIRQLARLKRMDESLYEDKLAGLITEGRYQAKRQEFADQALDIAERLEKLREIQEVATVEASTLESDNPIIDLYLKSSPSEKRTIMVTLFKKIRTDAGKVSFTLIKE